MYLSIGVPEEKFWDSTPYDLEPYLEAHKLRQEQSDIKSWQFNMYTMRAVQTAVANVLLGNKSKAKYFDKPFTEMVEKEKTQKELSEKEKKKEREKLLLTLQLWQANFELNHPKGEQET